MSLCKSASGEVFNLNDLHPKLLRMCIAEMGRRGCAKPYDCGNDVLTEYMFDNKCRNPDRIEYDAEQIRINFPNTTKQLPVLNRMLKYELLGKRSRCKECKYRAVTDHIADESVDEEGNEPRTTSVFLSEASNPEEIYEAKELVEITLSVIPDPVQRKAFEAGVIDGLTKKAVAKELKRQPATIRKWFERNRKRIARLLGNKIFRRKDT